MGLPFCLAHLLSQSWCGDFSSRHPHARTPVTRLCLRLALQVYLHQLAETQGSLLLPPVVIRILNAKACRSAIMFGDPLLPTECAQLVSSLKATQLCFSCAHGRPTMAPLVNLQAFHNQLSMRKHMPSLLARSSGNETVSLKQRLHSLLAKS